MINFTNNMPTCTFIPNPTLVSMSINKETVDVIFRRKDKVTKKTFLEKRVYEMDKLIAYGLFYADKPVTYFNKFIKKKTKVVKVELVKN